MIKPTIGRVVWFRDGGAQPKAALIAYVWDDSLVNLTISNQNGDTYGQTSVRLWDGEGEPPTLPYAEWMPYQKGQAAKTEELQKVVDGELGKQPMPAVMHELLGNTLDANGNLHKL